MGRLSGNPDLEHAASAPPKIETQRQAVELTVLQIVARYHRTDWYALVVRVGVLIVLIDHTKLLPNQTLAYDDRSQCYRLYTVTRHIVEWQYIERQRYDIIFQYWQTFHSSFTDRWRGKSFQHSISQLQSSSMEPWMVCFPLCFIISSAWVVIVLAGIGIYAWTDAAAKICIAVLVTEDTKSQCQHKSDDDCWLHVISCVVVWAVSRGSKSDFRIQGTWCCVTVTYNL